MRSLALALILGGAIVALAALVFVFTISVPPPAEARPAQSVVVTSPSSARGSPQLRGVLTENPPVSHENERERPRRGCARNDALAWRLIHPKNRAPFMRRVENRIAVLETAEGNSQPLVSSRNVPTPDLTIACERTALVRERLARANEAAALAGRKAAMEQSAALAKDNKKLATALENSRFRWIAVLFGLLATIAGLTLLVPFNMKGKSQDKPHDLREDGNPVITMKLVGAGTEIIAVPPPAIPATTPAAGALAIEAMVSAGPRKIATVYQDDKSLATDLCEDAAGVVVGPDAQLWWLCDGTGDSDKLPPVDAYPGLSARTLARDLGACFVQWWLESGQENLEPIFAMLAETWQTRIDGYIATLEKSGRADEFFRLGDTMGEGEFTLKWSSTFLAGIVQRNDEMGNRLTVFSAGDSGAIVTIGGDRPSALVVEPNIKRIFVQARITRGASVSGTVRVVVPEDGTAIVQVDHVTGFAAMSDGVIKTDLGAFLQQLQSRADPLPIRKIREGLLGRTDRSFDDKSIVVGWAPGV